MASFLRRFFSRRKKLPDNAEPKDNTEPKEPGKEKLKSKDSIRCNIILLDNETLTLDLPVFIIFLYFNCCYFIVIIYFPLSLISLIYISIERLIFLETH